MAHYIDADKLRAEIERRIAIVSRFNSNFSLGNISAYRIALSFIDTLEEPEVDEELNKAAEEYATDTFPISEETYVDYPKKSAVIAGAKWQGERLLSGRPLPEDTVLFQKGVAEGRRLSEEERGFIRDEVFREGMKYGYRCLLEEAVEGEIQMRYSGCLCAKTIRAINEDKFKLGDKVRIVVLKAEEE